MLSDHYGGAGMPADFWASDAFGDIYAAAMLGDAGEAAAGAWVDTLTPNPPHALVRKLAKDHGSKLFQRFLKLLRDDRVDLAKIGAAGQPADPARALYAAAYLSIAAGTNLAPVLREAGGGHAPADWGQRDP